jgi:LPS-assembly protein
VKIHRPLILLATSVLALAAGAATLPAPGDMISLKAVNQEWVQDQIWCGVGDVHVKYQDVSLRCDEIEVDLKTMKLHADGNVIFDQGTTRISATSLDFDLNSKVGTMYQVQAFFPPSYNFRGEKLEKLDATHWRFHRGVFTSCTLDDKTPPWSIEVRDAVGELEGYGHFRDAVLRVDGVPVFYTPRLLWPLKRDRAAGLLVPNVGYNTRHGFYLGNAFFWPVSRSFDTTFFLDTYTKRYLGLGEEFRWAPTPTAKGVLLADTIHDPATGRWQWKVRGTHTELFPNGYALRGEVLQLSDINFYQSFERSLEQNSWNYLYSYLTFSRTWGPQAYTLRVDHRDTFFSIPGGTSKLTQERLPEFEYRLRATRIARSPVYLSMVGVADEFRVNQEGVLAGRYGRTDLFPQISVVTPGFAWLSITPTVGARETYYTSRYATVNGRKALVPDPLSRQYFTGGLSLIGPSFTRVWTKGDEKIKHLIEPRLVYGYISNPGPTNQIPIFDEKDSVLSGNVLTATLSNQLLVKTKEQGSRQVAIFEISQAYSFAQPLTPAIPPNAADQRGPINFWLRALPLPTATIDARASLDPISKNLQSTAFTGGYNNGSNMLNLTWTTSYNTVTGATLSSQVGVMAAYGPAAKPWRIESQILYDLAHSKPLQERFILHWRGSCWSLYAEVRDYRIAPLQTRDYRIAIDLTGLGTFLDIRGGLD